MVAPVRERGLKLIKYAVITITKSRSREGAWIEIGCSSAWSSSLLVAPVRERGLKCFRLRQKSAIQLVAPVRERGLKLQA